MRRALATAAAVLAVVATAATGVGTGVELTGGQSDAGVDISSFGSEPVVLTGAQFPGWSSGPELTARAPAVPNDYGTYNSQGSVPAPLRSDCYQSSPAPDVNGSVDSSHNDHSCFQGSQLPVRTALRGVAPQSLLGYRWNGHAFEQIPFQVDTKWEHYISNDASGFSFYSGTDPMLTYTFDTEPFRFTSNPPFDPADPASACQAQPPAGQPSRTADPNPYLTDSDELAFMARDAGAQAPTATALPHGIVAADAVRLVDPSSGETRYVYVMESALGADGTPVVAPAYTATNSPYVRYRPAPGSDVFAYSQSNYSDYGNASRGPVCTVDADGTSHPVIGQGFAVDPTSGAVVLDPSTYVRRRTLDTAVVDTPRYRFTFDGRWILDGLQVSPDDAGLSAADYGTSLIDRFKGRAFQQSPGGSTPCCGYEDEQVNWNGSSITMGIRSGPVRTMRVTWGSDSGTNVTRTDVFYADSIAHEYNLRVHPIPPLDGIYTQWDMTAGAVTTYYNPYNPQGVPVTGINPVRMGDVSAFLGPSGISESSNDTLGRAVQQANGGNPLTVGSPNPARCSSVPIPQVTPSDCIYGSFDLPDPTFSGVAPELLSWEQLSGPAGTMVERWSLSQDQSPSPGGAQGVVEAAPYYVDDSCFDDGTGSSPGPQVKPRAADPTTWGFADQGGQPVAVSPAPAPADRFPGPVVDDGSTYDGTQAFSRRCWNHNADGTPYNVPGTATYDHAKPAQQPDPAPDPSFSPQGDVRYFQGDIATHGLHLLFTGDSDNADATVAVDEIDATDTQVVLPPAVTVDVGPQVDRQLVAGIQAVVVPFRLAPPGTAPLDVRGPGMPSSPVSGPSGTGSSTAPSSG